MPDQTKRKLYLRAIACLRPYVKYEALIFLLMAGTTLLSLPQPLAVKLLIDNVLVEKDISLLYLIVGGLLAAFLLQSLLSLGLNYFSNLVYQRISVDIRCRLYDHIQRLSPEFYNNAQTGDIMSRLLNDTISFSNLVATTLIKILADLLTLAALLGLIFYFDWKLSLLSLATLPFFVIALARYNRKIRSTSADLLYERSSISAFLLEALTMLKLTQTFNKEDYMSGRFQSSADDFARAGIKASMTNVTAGLISGVFIFIGPLVVLCYGGIKVIEGSLTIGTLVAFYSYLAQLYGPVGNLAGINAEAQVAITGIARVFELLDTEPEIKEKPDPVMPRSIRGEIEFRSVSFSYRDRPGVLNNVSFRVEPGSRVAFVGPSGAGKSTIVDLLCRHYDPAEGSVRLDGCDVRDLPLGFLRRQIGIVSQDTFLFDDSFQENIAFGGDLAPVADIEEAAKVADIHDFISGLPDGYQTIIGERGVRLSGGQRQRIAIARAVLRNPPIIVLDEATSSVDTIVERRIQTALSRLIEGKTVIVIAHRLSAIQNVDRIFLLDEGEIIADGSHEELLEASSLYRELFFRPSINECDTIKAAGTPV